MLTTIILCAIAYAAGAFSHKWIAAIIAKKTGLNAQTVADQVTGKK